MEFKKIVELDEKDQKALVALNDKQAAIQSFVGMVQRQAEQKMQEAQQDGRKIWGEIAEKYGLELDRAAYTLSQDGTKLVLTQVRYGNP